MIKVGLVLLLTSFVSAIVYVEQVLVSNNEKVANLTFQLFNDGIHDTVMAATCEYFADIEKMTVIFKVDIPENDEDQNFKRKLISSSLDVGKLLKGVQGNFVLRAFMENFNQSIDFEAKLPLKKGIYRVSNFSITDKYLPRIATKARVEVRQIGKLVGKKETVYMLTYKAFGKLLEVSN